MGATLPPVTAREESDLEPGAAPSPSEEGAPEAGPAEPEDAAAGPPPAPPSPKARGKKRAGRSTPSAEVERFAARLARLHVVHKGFRPATAQELAAFAGAGDVVVLSCSDGESVWVVCILDAEDDPGRVLVLDRDRLAEIGRAFGRRAGTMGGPQLFVQVHAIEVRDGIRDEDRRRLEGSCRSVAASLGRMPSSMKGIPGMEQVKSIALVVSPRTHEVWSTPGLGALEERWFRSAVAGPQETAVEHSAAAAGADGMPWLTLGIIGIATALFAAENALAVTPSAGMLTPALDTLVAMGGVSGALVHGRGEWWRVLTATLLHADPMHLLFNGVGLLLGGAVLESLLGRAWLGAIFVVGAVGGSLASIAINAPNVVSVGASGAIMALLAAALVASYRVPAPQRRPLQMPLLRMLVPSLLPVVLSRSGEHVDVAAHFGGAAAGAALGLALLWTWPAAERLPRFRGAASALAIAGVVLYAFGFYRVEAAHAGARETASVALVPDADLASITPENAGALLARYPRDPRAHWVAAVKAADAHDLPGAEGHLRAALAEEGVLRRSFPDRKLEVGLRGMLARVLDAEGRHEEALGAARPACDTGAEALRGYCP
jgi:rhomboid protease GluP